MTVNIHDGIRAIIEDTWVIGFGFLFPRFWRKLAEDSLIVFDSIYNYWLNETRKCYCDDSELVIGLY